MRKFRILIVIVAVLIVSLLLSGCVERRLTINTEPQGAIVVLNDEEIGISSGVTLPCGRGSSIACPRMS